MLFSTIYIDSQGRAWPADQGLALEEARRAFKAIPHDKGQPLEVAPAVLTYENDCSAELTQ